MLKPLLHFAWRSFGHFTRLILVGVALIVFVGGGGLLVLRHWVLPDIERYHDDITSAVSRAIGQPLSIGKIEADWRGLHPHLRLADVRVLDQSGQPALVLQRVDGVVSWRTALTGEVRLYSLELDRPDLLVKRDAQGRLYIAGVPLSSRSSDNDLANWLLRQSHIVVRDARITWQDEQRSAPALVFNRVNLGIENDWRRHRFAMRALPPPDLSAQLDVRGDFVGSNLDDLKAWRGQIYTQLDYADVAAWRAWLPLPAAFKRGSGALRGWLGVADGKVSQVTTDLRLAEVRTQLADDLSPLDMHMLRGRIAWNRTGQSMQLSTRQLSLQMNNGLMLPPTDLDLRLDQEIGGQVSGGEVRANVLELANLASLADTLPLERGLKRQLAEFAPRGRVADLHAKWQAGAGKPWRYEIRARFDQLAMKRVGNLPGFSGLSGEVDGSDTRGTVSVNARKLAVDAPGIMPEPLAFDTLTGQGSWQTNNQGLEVKFSNISAANADAAGTIYGSYQALPNSPGRLDLNVHLTRAAVHHADRYIPVDAVDGATHAWLRDALLDGQADEFSLRLRGDLNDFPFPDNKKGVFQIRAHTRGVVLEYDKAWPRIDNAICDLLIQGERMEVTSPSAMTVGERLKNVSVVIPDMMSSDLLLQVRGEAEGETKHGLDFLRTSPVGGYIDGFADGVTASGTGALNLAVDVPLSGDKPVKVIGAYRFVNNDVDLGGEIPVLRRTNGELSFTEASLDSNNLNTQILGGPATLSVRGDAEGLVRVKVDGHGNFDEMRKLVSHPVLPYLHGGSDWSAEITAWRKQTDVVITSSLVGMVSDLPRPFAKTANELMPLRIEKRNMRTDQDMVSLQYGSLLGAKFLRREEAGGWAIKRGSVNFGGPGKWPNEDGIWLSGTVPQLSLEGWGGLLGGTESGALENMAGADLLVREVGAYGYRMNDLRVTARKRNGAFSAQLAGRDINGELVWQGRDRGKLVARLKNLTLGENENGKKQEQARRPVLPLSDTADTEFPALDLVVDELVWKDMQLGRMELLAQQHGRDWLLERMRIANPDGVLSADGKYHWADGAAQTRVNYRLETSDAGRMLGRFGYPNSVRKGSSKLEGEFAWRGAPDEFSYAALDGMLKLDAGKGQFLKIDPGIGKLLGILSLQALPRHITLDFTDVFSNGFAFDSISGTAQVRQGVLTTNDLKIEGSSAKVTMQGQIDLHHETQNLRVRILPTVGNSVSMIGAVAAGPLVGIGTFIANKILREPLDKLVSFEYNVTGAWINPSVVRVGVPDNSGANNRVNIP